MDTPSLTPSNPNRPTQTLKPSNHTQDQTRDGKTRPPGGRRHNTMHQAPQIDESQPEGTHLAPERLSRFQAKSALGQPVASNAKVPGCLSHLGKPGQAGGGFWGPCLRSGVRGGSHVALGG